MLRIGETIDKYRIEALIGQGGMAAVYRARHITLGSHHAVKILFITAPSVCQRLLREGRVQANLRHPNIVAVTDVLEVMGAPALVMEYVEGPALDQWLRENEPTLDEALYLFRGILRGMMAAHEGGVIHRDLKPANIMLAPTNEGVVAKVTDFGLVKSLGDHSGKTQTGLAMGTPEYMAPEQIRDASDVDQRVDLFALGCILYELVCHRRAFAGPDNVTIFNNIVAGTYPPPRKFVEDLPAPVHEAIRSLLEPDREKRLASCGELFDLLYEEQAVGRLGSLKTQRSPIQISGAYGELAPALRTPPASEPRAPEPAPPAEPPTPEAEPVSLAPLPPRPGVSPLGRILPGAVTLAIVFSAVSAAIWLSRVPDEPTELAVHAADALPAPAPDLSTDPGAPEAEPSEPEGASAPPPADAPSPVDAPPPADAPSPVAAPVPNDPPAAPPGSAEPAPPVAEAPRPTAPAVRPVAPRTASVRLTGDARAAWLLVDGERLPTTAPIPPGSHRILADFGGPEPVAAGTLSVRAGQSITLECSSFLYQCRPR